MSNTDKEWEEMALGPWSIKTKHGYHADEVISALQKSIRRGDSDGAVFWAHEANVSGLGAWAWRRLFIITSEDVGLAAPEAPAVIAGLWTMSQVLLANQKKLAPGEPVNHPWLQLLQATWYLARLPKNRELADLCGVLDFRLQRGDLPEIPDVALDMHTAAGRAAGRGSVHFELETPEGGRWCAGETEIDGNRWRKEFYRLWQAPANPASRTYKAIDAVPENAASRDPE